MWVLYCLSAIFDNSAPIIISLLNDFISSLKGGKESDILKRGLFIKEECDPLGSHGLLVGKSPLFCVRFFFIGIYSMQDWTATGRHGVTRKRRPKILKYTWSLAVFVQLDSEILCQ